MSAMGRQGRVEWGEAVIESLVKVVLRGNIPRRSKAATSDLELPGLASLLPPEMWLLWSQVTGGIGIVRSPLGAHSAAVVGLKTAGRSLAQGC